MGSEGRYRQRLSAFAANWRALALRGLAARGDLLEEPPPPEAHPVDEDEGRPSALNFIVYCRVLRAHPRHRRHLPLPRAPPP
jgi:hypothetical protein